MIKKTIDVLEFDRTKIAQHLVLKPGEGALEVGIVSASLDQIIFKHGVKNIRSMLIERIDPGSRHGNRRVSFPTNDILFFTAPNGTERTIYRSS